MPADEKAEVIVEAARLRMMRAIEALMPFADQTGGITRAAEVVGDGVLVERQPQLRFIADMRIEFMAEARLVTSREKAGARGTAIRRGDVTAGATHAAGRERVDVGRRHVLAAVNADVAIAEIVGDDDEDVGFRGLCSISRVQCGQRSQQQGGEGGDRFHGVVPDNDAEATSRYCIGGKERGPPCQQDRTRSAASCPTVFNSGCWVPEARRLGSLPDSSVLVLSGRCRARIRDQGGEVGRMEKYSMSSSSPPTFARTNSRSLSISPFEKTFLILVTNWPF